MLPLNASSRTLCRLDLNDIKIVTKLGGTVDDSEMVDGMVFDKKAAKAGGGPSRMANAKIALVQFHISPPKTDLENNVIISDYAQVGPRLPHCPQLLAWISLSFTIAPQAVHFSRHRDCVYPVAVPVRPEDHKLVER